MALAGFPAAERSFTGGDGSGTRRGKPVQRHDGPKFASRASGSAARSSFGAFASNLSNFLRATLDLEPATDVRLAREIELQAVYLAIEEVRFPERL